MKRPGRVLGNLLAMVLALFSLQVMAADGQMAGRNFDHTTTGFPLVGGHATAACETCHVAGVFKSTPRNCDGCHALGKRVIATPKSTAHIVTDAPCDTCHFNTSTFLGARYNHGTAMPGQCINCHNGRITTGRPANHNAGFMVSESCDKCHRTYAFVPASWNHVGVTPGSCGNPGGCHGSDPGNPNRYTVATATAPINHSLYNDTRTKACDVCHVSFVSWSVTMHEPLAGTCSSCHNGANAQGIPTAPNHASFPSWPTECNQCHTSTVTWLGALGAMPSNHIPSSTFAPGATCGSCHIGTTVATGNVLHAALNPATTCVTCHNTSPVYLGSMTRKGVPGHEGSKAGDDCIKCHTRQYTRWNKP